LGISKEISAGSFALRVSPGPKGRWAAVRGCPDSC
jgi:hypothetical protein